MIFRLYTFHYKHEMVKLDIQTIEKSQVLPQSARIILLRILGIIFHLTFFQKVLFFPSPKENFYEIFNYSTVTNFFRSHLIIL